VQLEILSLASKDVIIQITSKGEELKHLTAKIKCDKSVFGVSPNQLQQTTDFGVSVPSLLVKMKESLIKYKAFDQEGIFRIPSETKFALSIRLQMDNFEFEENSNFAVVANLLKTWFRELPTPIFQQLPPEYLQLQKEEALEVLEALPEPEQSLVKWLLKVLDLCLEKSDINKMTAENLAIVWSPCLYNVQSLDTLDALLRTQAITQFIKAILSARKK